MLSLLWIGSLNLQTYQFMKTTVFLLLSILAPLFLNSCILIIGADLDRDLIKSEEKVESGSKDK